MFIRGPILPEKIADSVKNHQDKTAIGAHSIFLGQVREDEISDSKVVAIEYTAYESMALEKMHVIREKIIKEYGLTCMHVYHSLGRVEKGGICLFVFTSSAHRREAIDACEACVEAIKNELPIWGKEILDNEQHQWKMNS